MNWYKISKSKYEWDDTWENLEKEKGKPPTVQEVQERILRDSFQDPESG